MISESKPRFIFDPTVNLGHVLTAALNAGSIDLTWDGAATVSYVDVGYMRGATPDIGNVIRDDSTIPGSAVGAPLRPTKGLFRITAT